MATNGDRPGESGFELDGEFYRLTSSDQGKDLMLIDRLTAMPMEQFFEAAQNFDGLRGSVALALIATSVRAAHPDWSVERIVRIVQELHLSEVVWVGGEVEDDAELPPAQAGPQAGETEPASSPSTSDGYSSSSIQKDNSSSEMSSAIPA